MKKIYVLEVFNSDTFEIKLYQICFINPETMKNYVLQQIEENNNLIFRDYYLYLNEE